MRKERRPDIRLEYEAPLAELICFRPVEALASQTGDSYWDTMALFGGGFDPNGEITSVEDGDIGVWPWD